MEIQTHIISTSLDFTKYTKDASFLSSTHVKYLEFKENFEAFVDKGLSLPKYNDVGLLEVRKYLSADNMGWDPGEALKGISCV